MESHKIKISCIKDNLFLVRGFISGILKKNAIPELEANKVILAIDEICANLIIHANNCNKDNHIEVFVYCHSTKNFEFQIIDQGVGFDLSKYKEPTLEELKKKKRKGGLGLLLVRKIMDNVEFQVGRNQNICRLTKNFAKNQ